MNIIQRTAKVDLCHSKGACQRLSSLQFRESWSFGIDFEAPLSHARYPSSPLKPLHSDQSLSPAKLQEMERQTTDILEVSLRPGQPHCLKVRPDGTVLDGHHRIFILRKRGISVNDLPREIIEKG